MSGRRNKKFNKELMESHGSGTEIYIIEEYRAQFASSYDYGFCNYLRYYISRNKRYEHVSVTPPGRNRTVRIDTLVTDLTHDKLKYICT